MSLTSMDTPNPPTLLAAMITARWLPIMRKASSIMTMIMAWRRMHLKVTSMMFKM